MKTHLRARLTGTAQTFAGAARSRVGGMQLLGGVLNVAHSRLSYS